MDIHRYNLLANTEISCCTLEFDNTYIQECINEIYKLGDSMNHHTNLKASMSSYRVWEETSKFNSIFDNIMDTILSVYPLNKQWKYELFEAWSTIYKKGNMAVNHNHYPRQLSWIYYLQSTPNSSPLVFPDCNNFQVYPTNSLLVIFPAYLNHYVPEQESDEDRICLVGNLTWKSNDIKETNDRGI